MIKANELRHCNYYLFSGVDELGDEYTDEWGQVLLNDEYAYCVQFSSMSNELLSFFTQSQVQPVPLTEKVLTKNCGFTRERGDRPTSYRLRGLSLIKSGDYEGKWIVVGGFSLVHDIVYLQYLHELQNLYYNAVKEELSITI